MYTGQQFRSKSTPGSTDSVPTSANMPGSQRSRRSGVPTAKVPNYLKRFAQDNGGERPALLPTPNMPPLVAHYDSWDDSGLAQFQPNHVDEYGVYGSSYAGSISPSDSATSTPDPYLSQGLIGSQWTPSQADASLLRPASSSLLDNVCNMEPLIFDSLLSLTKDRETLSTPTQSRETSPEEIASLIDSIAGLFNPEFQ